MEMAHKERILQQLQVTYIAEKTQTWSSKKKTQELEATHSQQIQSNQRQGKEIESLKTKNKVVVENMVMAQKQLQEMLTHFPSKKRTKLIKENQLLKDEIDAT